jgi:hypothetical protein
MMSEQKDVAEAKSAADIAMSEARRSAEVSDQKAIVLGLVAVASAIRELTTSIYFNGARR